MQIQFYRLQFAIKKIHNSIEIDLTNAIRLGNSFLLIDSKLFSQKSKLQILKFIPKNGDFFINFYLKNPHLII